MAWLPEVPRRRTACCGPVDPRVLPHPHAPCDPLPEGGTPHTISTVPERGRLRGVRHEQREGIRRSPASPACRHRREHRRVAKAPVAPGLLLGVNERWVSGPGTASVDSLGSTTRLRTFGARWQVSYCEAGVPTGAHSECGFGPAPVKPSGQDTAELCGGCGTSPSTRTRSRRPPVRTVTPALRPAGGLGQPPFATTGVGV